jgi:hypothetical protein
MNRLNAWVCSPPRGGVYPVDTPEAQDDPGGDAGWP